MAQTPISASAQYNSTTPATIYTVPTGATAVVKSVLSASVIGGYSTVTINKVSSGVTYPIVYDAVTGYAAASGTGYAYPGSATLNLLQGPITLAAGDSLTISSSTSPQYKFPTSFSPTTNPTQKIANIRYLNGNYIAVGYDTASGYGVIWTSPDAVTWTKQTFNYAINLTDIAYDGSTYYVAVGTSSSQKLYYSTNLTSWTQQAAPFNNDAYCITYGNGYFVAGGNSGVVWYATTPTSWSTVQIFTTPTINSVLTIGTSWAFGTSTYYAYTSDFSTFTVPYLSTYLGNTTNQGWIDVNSAGKIFIGNASYSPDSAPNGSLQQSTDQGATYTAINLSSLSNKPTQACKPLCFGNGGYVYWQEYHPSDSKYLRSSDGVTWVSDNYTGTGSAQSGNWYFSNLYTSITTAYNTIFNYNSSGDYVTFLNVGSSGTVTYATQFTNVGSNIYGTGYGYLVPTGNGNTGSWVATGVSIPDPSYASQWYGSTSSIASNSTYTANVYNIGSWGYPVCGTSVPAGNGFLIGTTTGYVMRSSSLTGGYSAQNGTVRPFGNVQISGMARSGNSTTSKIVYITSTGQTAYSTDQGANWTVGGSISSTFDAPYLGNAKCLFYNGGYWYAQNNSGAIWYSTDGINWFGNPYNVQFMETVNSKNIMLLTTGLAYTNGTSISAFSYAASSIAFAAYPSVRRIAYVNSTYFFGVGSSIATSTDLSTFTQVSLNSTQINNQKYVSIAGSSTLALAYSGAGNNMVVGAALRAPTADNFSISSPTSVITSLSIGNATAGIVQIS